MSGANRCDEGVWLAVKCTVLGSLDGKEVVFVLRLHAKVRTHTDASSQ